MINIEKCCEFAEGFEYYKGDFIDDNYIETPCGLDIHEIEFNSYQWQKSYYPLLLNSTIEGINSSDKTPYFIQVNPYSICVHDIDIDEDVEIFDYNNPDYPLLPTQEERIKAKEAAVNYVLENIK